MALLQKGLDSKFFSFCIPVEGLGHHSSTVAQPRAIQDNDVRRHQLLQGSDRPTPLSIPPTWSFWGCGSPEAAPHRAWMLADLCSLIYFLLECFKKKKPLSWSPHKPERVWPLQRNHIISSSFEGILSRPLSHCHFDSVFLLKWKSSYLARQEFLGLGSKTESGQGGVFYFTLLHPK